ncbi:hypothetical protein FGO68_gene16734 [Halteria grandinella]|uniref:Uncharacterized protein n=1 Tax=Halteria grandinella TaxID=5974 RepID=A0A8J8T4V6_HALGN|nr:hypothetical protein FGO68_gene16734 [Halteria grandinella]
MGRIKSKYLIISIIVDTMHGKESLAYLSKSCRSFRSILHQVPHLLKNILIKKLKPLITCRQYNNFGLTGWLNLVPSHSLRKAKPSNLCSSIQKENSALLRTQWIVLEYLHFKLRRNMAVGSGVSRYQVQTFLMDQ